VDDQEPKIWKLEGELAIESGVELLEKMADREGCWVGEGVLAVGWAEFEYDREGKPRADVDARQIAKAYFRHKYDGGHQVSDQHKDMVKQLCETGRYVPPVTPPADPMAKFKALEKIRKKPKAEAKAKEPK
jgi:hypothetical protein